MHTHPSLHLHEHHRHTAQVTTDGLRRLEAARDVRARAVPQQLVHRAAQRLQQLRVRPVTG